MTNLLTLPVYKLLCFCLFFCIACRKAPSPLSSEVIAVKGGWGYNIFVNKKVIIHQDVVPALATQQPFAQKAEAAAAAALVIKKLQQKKSPTLSKFEVNHILANH